jgi:UDP-GlcNAc:undecaprenyl-phosphate GlcNAc-1-phosphate transferase
LPLEARLATGLALALAVVYWSTPIAVRIADRFEFYDRPVGYKGHGAPTPYLGGLAVVAGYAIAVLALTAEWDRTAPLLGGVAVLWAVGTIDDRRTVTPGLRVAVELGLAAMLWQLGLGWDLGAGAAVDLVVTAAWIVAVVNAFNLFDNMDGAASSMGGVVSLGLAVLGLVNGDAWLVVAAAALAGACLGFLPHNLLRSPARIFLGDGGSMPIGFAVATLAMIGTSGATAAWQSLAMGVLFVGVPALDTSLVVVSRRRRGIPLLTGGRDHLTHRTHTRMRTARAVAITLGGAQAITSALALVAIGTGSAAVVGAVTAYVVAVGVTIAVLDARFEHAAGALPARGRRSSLEIAAPALLVPVAAVAGLSPFAFGYYDSSIWVPAGLVLVLAVTAGAIARPVRLAATGWTALGALAGLGLLALTSSLWADSIEQAVTEGNRLLVYAVLLGGMLLVVRSDRAALWLMGAFAATAVVVAAVVLARMLGGAGSDLFVAGRLDRPLGYINGEASFFLLALWPCLAAAEQRRSAVLAGAGMAGAVALACLLLLSQSRGVGLACLASVAVVVALVPGRVRRGWALVVLGAAVALAAPTLLDVFDQDAADGIVQTAGGTILLAGLGAGAIWGASAGVAREWAQRPWGPTLAGAGLGLIVAVVLLAGLVNAGRLSDTVSHQYNAFVHLGVEPQGSAVEVAANRSRLVSGAGNRYDYWRIAWQAFERKPLLGTGAGGYDAEWFAHRATTEDVRQPHSVELQALSELGLAGAALLALLLGAVGLGAWRTARAAVTSPSAAAVAVGATGIGSAWLVHTSVDWIHLLPGVTAAALVAAAVLLRPRGEAAEAATAPVLTRGRSLAFAIAAALVLTTAGMSLMRQALAEHYRSSAQAALAGDPAEAIRQADRALRLDGESLPAYYVKAAGLARLGDASASTATLAEAARREPHDFVTWALLGDLAVRTGDEAAAQRNYARAATLNPRDPGLAALAKDPTP